MMLLLSVSAGLILLVAACSATTCTKTTPTDGSLCNVRGRVRDKFTGDLAYGYYSAYATVEPQFVNSLTDCAELCARRLRTTQSDRRRTATQDGAGCRSFQFSPDSKICQIGWLNISTAINTEVKNGDGDFYDSACFDCGDSCDQPFNAQMLDNGDFEGRLFGPWHSENAYPGKGFDSRRSWYCPGGEPKKPNSFQSCILDQYINSCAGHIYHVKFYYKAVENNATGQFGASFGTWTFESGPIQSSKTWKPVHGFWTSSDPSASSVALTYISISFPYTYGHPRKIRPNWYFDNLTISRVDPNTLKKTKQGSEVIKNGGFETGAIPPWIVHYTKPKAGGVFEVESPGVDDSAYVLHYRYNNSMRPYYDSPSLNQSITVKPNVPYILRMDVDLQTPPSNELELKFGHGHGSTYRSIIQQGKQEISIPFVSPYPTFFFSFQFRNLRVDNEKRLDAIFDNISIKELVDVIL